MNYQELINSLNKEFGKDTVVKDVAKNVEAISTGCIALDTAIGVGGIPLKRITEYYGGESSGKTTMALQTAANAQRAGKNVIYMDAEHALDIGYAAALGVDVAKMVIIQPDNAETALEIIVKSLEKYSDNLGLIVLDSVAAMIPKAEADSEVGDASVGLHARLLSTFIRRVTPLLNHSQAALLLINQQRAQIGGMTGFGGPGKTTPGGYALKHGASVRIEFARTGNATSKEKITGIKVVANIKKNKVAPPYQKVEYEIEFGNGTAFDTQIMTYAEKLGIITRSSSWFKLKDQSLGQGMDKAITYLVDNGLMLGICKEVLDSLFLEEKAKESYMNRANDLYA